MRAKRPGTGRKGFWRGLGGYWMCLYMYVAMSENRFLRFLPFRLFRVSHSMKCQNMMGRLFVFEREAYLLDLFYPLSCTLTLWKKICKSEQMTLISEFLFSTKESTNSGSKYFKPPSQKQIVAPSCFDTSCYEKQILISKSFAQIYIFFFTMLVCKIKGKTGPADIK
jgi:hypothetical protein